MLAPHPPHQMACSLNNSSISNSIDIVAILIPAEKTKSDILIETFMSRPKNDMFYYLISFFIEMKLKLKVGKFFIALTLGFLKVACYCYPTWNAFRFSWKILLSTGKDPTHFRKIYFSHLSRSSWAFTSSPLSTQFSYFSASAAAARSLRNAFRFSTRSFSLLNSLKMRKI